MPFTPRGTPAITLPEHLFHGGNRMHDIILPQEGPADPILSGSPSASSPVQQAVQGLVQANDPVSQVAKQKAWDDANRKALEGLYQAGSVGK